MNSARRGSRDLRRVRWADDQGDYGDGGVTFNELREAYYVQAKGLVEGGVDLLLVETCQDTRNIKAAILAIQRLSKEIGSAVPFVISVTIEPMGSMLAGQTVEAMWRRCGTRSAGVWDELRDRAGVHDGPHSNAEPAHR